MLIDEFEKTALAQLALGRGDLACERAGRHHREAVQEHEVFSHRRGLARLPGDAVHTFDEGI